ncbi:hypothetical protein CC78DRAFT_273138 [Lojkania enalia]|uniref:tRNA (guanine(9)-N1)-methyltransferase n=1 Tax=Lojkania enalia TaxID=147567 RepID=A0A9P4K646_9PLEO|nr:hypothetical protein CC78DRAFT_273138 [Didymosphaeria enalia]
MESEERPAKMRKLDNGTSSISSSVNNSGAAKENPELKDITPNSERGQIQDPENKIETAEPENSAPGLSKNQLKKQRRFEKWEAGRETRKAKRKEKIKAKKERRRAEWESNQNGAAAEGVSRVRSGKHSSEGVQVPIAVVFDCDFEDLMFDNELKSLGLQITRCYSDNRKSPFQCHLAVSSFGGKLKERFDGILARQYLGWKGFQFFEEDFVAVAEKSREWMKGSEGGTIAGALEQEAEVEDGDKEGEIVYLSSESSVTLERLKPNSTYIIGGLVDKNRHKGICYKRAKDRGIKTAKLPIGEYLQMNSRQALVTNHVLEIMLKWMEFGDWGKAFMEVIPKRKGGVLKSDVEGTPDAKDGGDEEDDGTPEADGLAEAIRADSEKAIRNHTGQTDADIARSLSAGEEQETTASEPKAM